MQLIALNYQTTDPFQILNLSLFEQNANSGYVLKPSILWNKLHAEYGRFNPFEKKRDGEYLAFKLKLISGQYLTDSVNFSSANGFSSNATMSNAFANTSSNYVNNNSSSSHNHHHHHHHHTNRNSGVELLQSISTFIEIEILGIPCDCIKEKTKTFNKNALNPIWNEEFTFNIVFPELAFVKFTVYDNNNNHVISQRVIPLKCFRQGYRHIKLRNAQNQTIELSSLFVHTKQHFEHVQQQMGANLANSTNLNASKSDLLLVSNASMPSIQAKHKQFKLTIYGVNGDTDESSDGSMQVNVTQETNIQQVIEQVFRNFLP
jgi:phosphatidylinositol phospholipase C, epsilon